MDYNLFGRWLARRCGATPPPIYFMPPPWIEEFVRGAHDDEIAAFARVMREGTKAQQEATILATLNRP